MGNIKPRQAPKALFFRAIRTFDAVANCHELDPATRTRIVLLSLERI